MQSAATVLGVLRERGRRGLPCDELYRQLFNPQLYLHDRLPDSCLLGRPTQLTWVRKGCPGFNVR